MSHTVLRALGVLLALVLLTPGAPAHADDRIEFSRDGRTWVPTLDAPLFDPAVRWVPGDSRVESFLLRNQGPSAAEILVAVTRPDGAPFDAALAADVLLEARVAGAAWQPLTEVDRARRLSTVDLPRGRSLRLDVRAAFEGASTNQTMRTALGLAFRVQLAEGSSVNQPAEPTDPTDPAGPGGPGVGGPGAGEPGGDSATGPDGLGDTGAPAHLSWLLLLAAGLIGTGLALLRSKESRDER